MTDFDGLDGLLDALALGAVASDMSYVRWDGGYATGDLDRGWVTAAYPGRYRLYVSPLTGQVNTGGEAMSVADFSAAHGGSDYVGVQGEPVDTEAPGYSSHHGAMTYEIRYDAIELYEHYTRVVGDLFRPWRTLPDPEAIRRDVDPLVVQIKRISPGAAPTGAAESAVTRNGSELLGQLSTGSLPDDVLATVSAASQLEGIAMERFARRYVFHLPPVLTNLQLLLTALGCGISAQAEVVAQARGDVIRTVSAGVRAMDAARPEAPADSSVGLQVVLAIAGAALGGASAFIAGPLGLVASLAAGGSLLSSAAGFVGSEPAEKQAEVPLGAATANGVLANLDAALAELNAALTSEEQTIEKVCGAWQIAVLTDPTAFSARSTVVTLSEQEQIRVSEHDCSVVWNGLEEIASVVRANAARFEIAEGTYERDPYLGLGPQGARPRVTSLRDLTHDTMRAFGRELLVAAEGLRDCWRYFQGQDTWIGSGIGELTVAVDHVPLLSRRVPFGQRAPGVQDAVI